MTLKWLGFKILGSMTLIIHKPHSIFPYFFPHNHNQIWSFVNGWYNLFTQLHASCLNCHVHDLQISSPSKAFSKSVDGQNLTLMVWAFFLLWLPPSHHLSSPTHCPVGYAAVILVPMCPRADYTRSNTCTSQHVIPVLEFCLLAPGDLVAHWNHFWWTSGDVQVNG